MDVLTQIQRLINIKKSFINVLANIGYVVSTFQEIISTIENYKQGDLDKSLMSALTAEDKAVRMDESVYDLYERLFAQNETLLSSVDTLAFKSFYETNLVYFKSKPCNAIIDDAFSSCRSLMFAELDQATDCTTLNSTFRRCNNLVAVELPPSLDKCKDLRYTFSICASLRKVNLPKQLPVCTSIAYIFENCRNLDIDIEFTYLPKVIRLDRAFYGCSSLSSVTLPTEMPALTSLRDAFHGCSSLSSVTLPTEMPALTSINSAFSGCSKLSSVTLPTEMPALTSMRDTFHGCSSLSSVTLPTEMPALTSLGFAFNSCRSLSSVTLPTEMPALTTMTDAFSGCSSLSSVTLPTEMPALTSLNHAFHNCRSLSSVTLPTEMPALTSLGYAFDSCISLSTPLDIDCTNVLATTYCNIFAFCKKIPSLTLHSTANIYNFNYFIYNCTSLTSVTGLDLSNAFLSVDEVKQVAAANNVTISDADAETVYRQTSWLGCTQTNTKLTNMPLQGTLYRSGFSIASCPLTAESLYTWFVALYDWTNNPEAKTTDDTTHTLTVNATSLANMQEYVPNDGVSGEEIYLQAIEKGWIIQTT